MALAPLPELDHQDNTTDAYREKRLQFFAIVLLVSAILHGRNRLRILFLSAASFSFYYASNGYLTLLIVFATFFDFIAAKRIFASSDDAVRKRWMIASITSNLLILCVFKYSNLFLTSAAHAVTALGINVAAPIFELAAASGNFFLHLRSNQLRGGCLQAPR